MRSVTQGIILFSIALFLQGCLKQLFTEPAVESQAMSETSQLMASPPASASPVQDSKQSLNAAAQPVQTSSDEILITGLNIEKNTIQILINGQIRDYKVLTLFNPSRLVIDIHDATSSITQKNMQIDKLGIAMARFENRPDAFRITLDAEQWRIIPYRVEETGTGLKIIITTPQ